MSTASSSIRSAPAPVLLLGLGGLLPFIGLTALALFLAETWYIFWLTTLAQYGVDILSFVGALQWGHAICARARGVEAWLRYGWGVLPALVGVLSLQFPIWTALRVQAGALILCVVVDRALASTFGAPAWLLPVRYFLTGVAASCLLVASYA